VRQRVWPEEVAHGFKYRDPQRPVDPDRHLDCRRRTFKRQVLEGTLEMKESLADCRAFGTVKVTSVDTGEPQRDDHLRSADFFNVQEFPEITFESTHAEAIDDESTRVFGNLTMHGITKEITLDVLVQGTDTDPWGNTRAGLEIVGKLLRSDFDMKFNQALGSGNMLVGDKVGLALDISAVLQTPS
jgi:polyisoprenoid-binding protein YceI